jgi:hypothetical protein
MRLPRLIPLIAALALLLVGAIVLRDQQRRHPERLPWTPLSLSRPIGPFTGAKIVGLTEDADQCRQLLREAGVAFTPLSPIAGEQCGYADGVTLVPGGSLASRFQPAPLATACPVAAALLVWEREIVRPAAQRHFKTGVAAFEHFGSFNCRRIAGSPNWSEHATADAIDIAGFRLADGRRVRVLAGWTGKADEAAFLREVRDGACRLFGTTLSPDYNAAHADHFHLDQAKRGMAGGGVCR